MSNIITVRAGYYGNIKEYTFPEASQVIELSDKIRGELGIQEKIELVFQKRACPMSAYPSGFSPLEDGSTYITDVRITDTKMQLIVRGKHEYMYRLEVSR